MPTRVAFESSSAARYLTDDGRSLSFGDEIVVGMLDIRFEHRSETDEMPTDVAACDLLLADADGRVWKTTSRSTTEVFMRHLHDFAATDGDCFSLKYAPKSFMTAVSSRCVLEDARFSSDDRFYRRLNIGGEVFQTQFYYTTVRLDVGIVPDEAPGDPLLTRLAVRIRNNCLVHVQDDTGDTGVIGEFGFFMDWRYLLSNTAVFSPGYGQWLDMAIPMPLVFSATDDTGQPQPQVVVQ